MDVYLQVGGGSVEETLCQFELLHSETEVVAVGKLVGRGGNTGAVVHPELAQNTKLSVSVFASLSLPPSLPPSLPLSPSLTHTHREHTTQHTWHL